MTDEFDDQQPDAIRTNSPNATYFAPSDAASDKQDKYEMFWRWNEGLWKSRNRVNQTEAWRRDRLNVLSTIASQLELSSVQKERARGRLEDIDFGEAYTGRQQRIEASCFGICSLVYNQDVKPQREGSCIYLPHKDDENNPEHFVTTKEDIGLSDTEISESMKQIRKITGNQGDE